MASQEVSRSFHYQGAMHEVAQAAWIITGGENPKGVPAPERESLSRNEVYHPQRVFHLTLRGTLLTATKVFGPHLAVNFVGEIFGNFNPISFWRL